MKKIAAWMQFSAIFFPFHIAKSCSSFYNKRRNKVLAINDGQTQRIENQIGIEDVIISYCKKLLLSLHVEERLGQHKGFYES